MHNTGPVQHFSTEPKSQSFPYTMFFFCLNLTTNPTMTFLAKNSVILAMYFSPVIIMATYVHETNFF